MFLFFQIQLLYLESNDLNKNTGIGDNSLDYPKANKDFNLENKLEADLSIKTLPIPEQNYFLSN
jgi:hypothetical protein